MRSLVLVFLVCFMSWIAAASAIVYSTDRANKERKVLVNVVCQAVLIREEHGDPHASEYRRRYSLILAEIGEHCPP